MKFNTKRARILSIIAEKGPLSISDLARLSETSMGTTIHRYIEELESKGLIESFTEKKKQGKPRMLRVTSKAAPIAEETWKFFERFKKL